MPIRLLTQEEQRAIAALKRVASRWPKTLWLFSGSGTLNVMLKNERGEPAHIDGGPRRDGVDPDYVVATVNIENDGGDW